MSDLRPFRGYVASRLVNGQRCAQHVQNLVIRDHCQRLKLGYQLSAVEYGIDNCFMILDQSLNDLTSLSGLVFYSLFMLPEDAVRRHQIYRIFLDHGAELHGALEGVVLKEPMDFAKWEETCLVQQILPFCPKDLVDG